MQEIQPVVDGLTVEVSNGAPAVTRDFDAICSRKALHVPQDFGEVILPGGNKYSICQRRPVRNSAAGTHDDITLTGKSFESDCAEGFVGGRKEYPF